MQEQRFTEAERLTEEARRAAREAHLKAEEALSKVRTKMVLPATAKLRLMLPPSKCVTAIGEALSCELDRAGATQRQSEVDAQVQQCVA